MFEEFESSERRELSMLTSSLSFLAVAKTIVGMVSGFLSGVWAPYLRLAIALNEFFSEMRDPDLMRLSKSKLEKPTFLASSMKPLASETASALFV